MRKDLFKNSNSYSVSIIAVPEISCDHSITTLTCKNTGEIKSDNPVKEKEINSTKNSISEETDGEDFEAAIQATGECIRNFPLSPKSMCTFEENTRCPTPLMWAHKGHGKFNWLLLFVASWGFMSCMNATTTMSLILPSAECDLNLSNFDKGLLNSVIFVGMTVSAFFWGLLSDAVGRKNVLIVGFALDAFFSTLVSLAQNFTFLLIAKLFAGFISSGPLAILATYLAETHSNNYRGCVVVCTGIFTSSANVILPFLAWLIIPQDIRLVLFGGYLSLPSWRIFLLISAIPSAAALIGMLFLDESPKFLMFQGNNEEALRVLRKIYKINTGKPEETFPVKSLKNEMGIEQKDLRKGALSVGQIFSTGWKQMVPVFQRPYVLTALHLCSIQFFTILGVNTIRLWSPQLFASAIEREKYGYNLTAPSTVCELLETATGSKSIISDLRCSGHIVEDKVYFNSMITGAVTGIGYLISGYIVRVLEKKWLMTMAYSLGIISCFGLYWSNTSDMLLGVVSVFIAFLFTSATALISAVIDIFPTSLRTTTVSLAMTFGRLGAMMGNLAFPLLLDLNCTIPFILLAVVLLVAMVMTVLLPNTKGKRLE